MDRLYASLANDRLPFSFFSLGFAFRAYSVMGPKGTVGLGVLTLLEAGGVIIHLSHWSVWILGVLSTPFSYGAALHLPTKNMACT